MQWLFNIIYYYDLLLWLFIIICSPIMCTTKFVQVCSLIICVRRNVCNIYSLIICVTQIVQSLFVQRFVIEYLCMNKFTDYLCMKKCVQFSCSLIIFYEKIVCNVCSLIIFISAWKNCIIFIFAMLVYWLFCMSVWDSLYNVCALIICV